MIQKEGKIILPIYDNERNSLADLHDRLFEELCGAFGGCTRTQGTGGWIDPESNKLDKEPVLIYTVASNGHDCLSTELGEIARIYGRDAGQKAVYWVDFRGSAHIENLPAAHSA